MTGHVSALAMSTFRETVRDRIFYLVAVFGFVMLASTAVLSPLTIGAQGKIMSDVGLAAMSIFGLLVIVFVGSNMVRKEMEKGTILTSMMKNIDLSIIFIIEKILNGEFANKAYKLGLKD